MYTINLDSIKNYKEKINSEKRNFNSQAYNTFRSSYLNNCSESIVRKMSSQLNKKYDKIKTGYSNISTWMNDYTSNALSIESYLSGSGGGGIQDSGLRSFALSKLILPTANYATNTIIGGMNLTSDYAKAMVGVQSGVMDLVKSSVQETQANVGKLANSAISGVTDAVKNLVDTDKIDEVKLKVLTMAYPALKLGMKAVKTNAEIASRFKSEASEIIKNTKNFSFENVKEKIETGVKTAGNAIVSIVSFPYKLGK